MMQIKELDVIRLTKYDLSRGLVKGQIGTILEVYDENNFKIEVSNGSAVTLTRDWIEPNLSREMSYVKLGEYLKDTMYFGVMELNLIKSSDGYKIEVIIRNKHIESGIEGMYIIHADLNGVIGGIEHDFRIMTRANKADQLHLLNLIDVKITGV